jgi:hypothetical protein
VITGLTTPCCRFDEVFEKELILFVTMNVNKNTTPWAHSADVLQNLSL